jgi:hypothetical protein
MSNIAEFIRGKISSSVSKIQEQDWIDEGVSRPKATKTLKQAKRTST